jgi:hypothetical protein
MIKNPSMVTNNLLYSKVVTQLDVGEKVTRGNSHARILLAEDNPACQKLALAMLKRLSYKADAANNGLKVLQL